MIPAALDPAPTYPIDAALHEAIREARAADDPSAIAAAHLDLAIREHRLFGSLVTMLRTGHVRIEEPRRMAATAKAALMCTPDFAPAQSALSRAHALASLIVDDLDVVAVEHNAITRQALVLASDCLPRAARRVKLPA